MKRKTPLRQVHLDFHTSPAIDLIADKFDAEEFASKLKQAKVESINLFAKCHHGMYYYPTRIGRVHPGLKEPDLLVRQIKACRDYNIRPIVYTCVGWCEDTADQHPEWLERNVKGVTGNKPTFERPYYSWQKLCLNNPDYRDYIQKELTEIYEMTNPDGFWIDIIFQNQCVCGHCRANMRSMNLDPEQETDRYKHDRFVQIEYMKIMFTHIKKLNANLEVYFNGHPYEMDLADDNIFSASNKRRFNTFIDIESLPSEMWGYVHFPIAINYVNKFDIDLTMMNGRFHTSWGDFGSLRNEKALEYESFRALANGAGCCIGDQLHPVGKLDETTYKRIGEIFRKIEIREKWCEGSKKIAQIGVFTTRKAGCSNPSDNNEDIPVEGAFRMLTELKFSVDIIDFSDDLLRYELVILPDNVYVNEQIALKLDDYVSKGGKIIFSSNSALDSEGKKFQLISSGLEYFGDALYCPRYMKLDQYNFRSIDPMTYVTYVPGTSVKAKPNAKVLAYIVNPYFNRSEERFCSHRQTPPTNDVTDFAAITICDGIAYLANPLFSDYAINRCKVFRDIVSELIQKLEIEPMVMADVPTYVEITTREICLDGSRYLILHILNYIIEHKSRTIDTIENVVPLFNREFSVKTNSYSKSVWIFDEESQLERELPANYADNRLIFNIPQINGYEIIIIKV